MDRTDGGDVLSAGVVPQPEPEARAAQSPSQGAAPAEGLDSGAAALQRALDRLRMLSATAPVLPELPEDGGGAGAGSRDASPAAEATLETPSQPPAPVVDEASTASEPSPTLPATEALDAHDESGEGAAVSAARDESGAETAAPAVSWQEEPDGGDEAGLASASPEGQAAASPDPEPGEASEAPHLVERHAGEWDAGLDGPGEVASPRTPAESPAAEEDGKEAAPADLLENPSASSVETGWVSEVSQAGSGVTAEGSSATGGTEEDPEAASESAESAGMPEGLASFPRGETLAERFERERRERAAAAGEVSPQESVPEQVPAPGAAEPLAAPSGKEPEPEFADPQPLAQQPEPLALTPVHARAGGTFTALAFMLAGAAMLGVFSYVIGPLGMLLAYMGQRRGAPQGRAAFAVASLATIVGSALLLLGIYLAQDSLRI